MRGPERLPLLSPHCTAVEAIRSACPALPPPASYTHCTRATGWPLLPQGGKHPTLSLPMKISIPNVGIRSTTTGPSFPPRLSLTVSVPVFLVWSVLAFIVTCQPHSAPSKPISMKTLPRSCLLACNLPTLALSQSQHSCDTLVLCSVQGSACLLLARCHPQRCGPRASFAEVPCDVWGRRVFLLGC